MNDDYLTVDEISKKYRVSSYTVRKWAREKKIKSFKIGRKWLFEKNLFFEKTAPIS